MRRRAPIGCTPAGPRHADVLPDAHARAPPPHRRQRARPGDLAASAAAGRRRRARSAACRSTELAAEHGTPALFLDEDDLRARAAPTRDAFDGVDVYYAGKAFLCTTRRRAGSPRRGWAWTSAPAASWPSRSPPASRPSGSRCTATTSRSPSCAGAVDAGVGPRHRRLLRRDRPAGRARAAARACGSAVLVRVTVGVEAHTHEFIATAHEDQKFGFSLRDGAAAEAVAAVLARRLAASSPACTRTSARRSSTPPASRSPRTGSSGCGRGSATSTASSSTSSTSAAGSASPTSPATTRETPKQTLERLSAIVERECAAAGLRRAAAVGRAGPGDRRAERVTVYEVGTVKDVTLDGGHARTYVSVDGGMSDNIRTALYDADYTCALANRAVDAPRRC